MYKKLLPIALLFSSAIYSQTAKDTLWVNAYDETTTKALASSFRVSKPFKQKKGYEEITTYNKETKAIEIKGIGSFDSNKTISYDGKVTYYNADGSINFDMFFEEGNAIKITSTDPFTQEEYTLTYENGYPYDGTMVQLYKNSYFYYVINEGVYLSYIYVNKDNANEKYLFTFDDDNNIIDEQFINAAGETIFSATYEGGAVQNGTSIILDYDTFRPLATNTYVDGVNTASTYYFKSGEVKYKTTATSTQTTTVFYDEKGKTIGTYKADLDTYGSETNQEGIYLFYNEYTETPDTPTSQSEYKKGSLVKETIFYDQPTAFVPKSTKFYKGDYYLEKIEYFNTDGSKKGELIYNEDGYTPQNGVLYDDESITTYKDGILVEKKSFYSSGEIFEDATEFTSTYYNKKGAVIGKLQSKKGTYGYTEPFQGDFITLSNDEIGTKISYDKGRVVYSATYEPYPSYDSKPILREEVFTPLNGTSKRVFYTRQGKKSREELFNKNDYDETILKVTYFDTKGKVTGVFDNIEKEGTYYTFFDNDAIESTSTYSKGELVYKKEYANKNGSYSTEIDPYLASEINYNKEGVFYDMEGNQIAKASYKAGKPYTGTVSVYDGYATTITTYEKGLKEGIETFKSDYADYIATKTYYKAGEIVKEENYLDTYLQSSKVYKDGELHGPAKFYDEEGELVATLEYKEGYAHNGTSISYGYESNTYTTYENGLVTYDKTVSTLTGLMLSEETVVADGTIQKNIYDENESLVYQYGLKDYALHGTCTYFEKGKAKYKSTFKEGRFVEGTVALKTWGDPYSYYDYDDTTYFVCTLQKNSMTIQRVAKETNKVVFELTSKLKKGKMEDNPVFQNKIDSTNLYPEDNNTAY
ncbi:hypothetical protein [Myroides odoratus]|uniref:MORN repeat variant n=1 Tax=Myroides odoratus TaxID=256 RepID=A0A378RQ23_MYROD|nr:hypothetical protein [Myroides odoratus]QQU04321.1 hypothetical protein I6I89_03290 [Myroides odoratus]STZ28257.1 Uncharacterised protein [Myroides odoratus]